MLLLLKVAADLITVSSAVKEIAKNKKVQQTVLTSKIIGGIALQKLKQKISKSEKPKSHYPLDDGPLTDEQLDIVQKIVETNHPSLKNVIFNKGLFSVKKKENQ